MIRSGTGFGEYGGTGSDLENTEEQGQICSINMNISKTRYERGEICFKNGLYKHLYDLLSCFWQHFNLNIRFFLQNIGFYKLCTYFIQILTWPVRKGQFTFFFQT